VRGNALRTASVTVHCIFGVGLYLVLPYILLLPLCCANAEAAGQVITDVRKVKKAKLAGFVMCGILRILESVNTFFKPVEMSGSHGYEY
jgi:hypothetical protein